MATVTTSPDVSSFHHEASPGLLRRFYAALIAARMRDAEQAVRRARRSIRERGVVDAEFLGALPPSGRSQTQLGS